VIVKNYHTLLIGLVAAQKMGLVTIEEDNMERVLACVKEFSVVFDVGLGSLPGETRLRVTENTTHTTMPDRRTPISILEKLESKIDRMESLGMLAKFTEPIPWVSQLVIAHKKSGDLRIC
jgi:hypothetical protein